MKEIKFKFPTKTSVLEQIANLVDESKMNVLQNLLDETGFNSVEELQDKERNCYFGFDCGFIYLVPKEEEMRKEWKKQGKWKDDNIMLGFGDFPIALQSTTCNRIMALDYLETLGLDKYLRVKVVLD